MLCCHRYLDHIATKVGRSPRTPPRRRQWYAMDNGRSIASDTTLFSQTQCCTSGSLGSCGSRAWLNGQSTFPRMSESRSLSITATATPTLGRSRWPGFERSGLGSFRSIRWYHRHRRGSEGRARISRTYHARSLATGEPVEGNSGRSSTLDGTSLRPVSSERIGDVPERTVPDGSNLHSPLESSFKKGSMRIFSTREPFFNWLRGGSITIRLRRR